LAFMQLPVRTVFCSRLRMLNDIRAVPSWLTAETRQS